VFPSTLVDSLNVNAATAVILNAVARRVRGGK